MSTQARPLSFADQAFQNQKKKPSGKRHLKKWRRSYLGIGSPQQLNHIIIARAVEVGSPIRWRRCYEYI